MIELTTWRKEPSQWWAHLTHACSLQGMLHTSSQLESLESLPDFQCWDSILMDSMWNDYEKLFISYLMEVAYLENCRELELSFLWAPHQWACKHSLTCHVCYHSILAQLYCWACARGLHFPWTIWTLKIGQALNSLSFEWRLVNSNSWGLQLKPYYKGGLRWRAFTP